jgi:bifunctional UDP-N-acetylglucosamine pyrophosphorylase/glucosamine-1-phosphate N-acetyltransferase
MDRMKGNDIVGDSMVGPIVLVLAAGLGTRMKSKRAKVLHEVAGRPLIVWAVETARAAGASRVIAILGHQLADVKQVLDARYGAGVIDVAHQTEQKGTGHAVRSALPNLENEPDDRIVIILSGDAPLLLPSRISELAKAAEASPARMALLSTRPDRTVAYGHLVRDAKGALVKIVEHKDASAEEKKITEVNAGFYAVSLGHLRKDVASLSSQNAQGELYLTDLAASAYGRGGAAVLDAPFTEISGINDRADLAAVETVARARINDAWMKAGVTLLKPESILIDADVDPIGGDTRLAAGVQILGRSKLGAGVRLDAGCVIDNSEIGDGVHIRPYTVVRSSKIDAQVTVGSFVEVLETHIMSGCQIGQHCYVGRATIGSGAILGAGTITCDFDGLNTAKTTIESGAFIGASAQLVAPVTVGRESFVAAGTTVTRDVTRSALALARMKQVNVEGWAERFREAHGKRKR